MVGMDRRAAEPFGNGAPVLRDRAKQNASGDPRNASPGGHECSGPKTRYEQLRQRGRAKPRERVGNHRPGLGLSAAYGLQLDIRAETQRGEKAHGFFQGGHALLREGGAEPSSRVVTSYRRQGERAQLSPPVCRALQPSVVKQDRM